ncbi:4-hydroxy-tetrahydrodipicolinate reductase [Endobacter medicaginis]|uniref:4-hydroxy-tetrahydrodipicolinate reductase n=2 Tax=Endobacter medicaginis TaxID=1181271 RepID=A0A839V5U9_9PROT|nr:4-hydroxy-tetrahydrodipicolinate reductase [Endobacter medicaginis]MBB3174909.1 4-hydroxy-tetrahydrodipicolinate reductase [Endobacter medicaginis]MCX5475872.1 4-hydroxy-tetrahydrodipicolinate reductase [Endobacter medicaginis]
MAADTAAPLRIGIAGRDGRMGRAIAAILPEGTVLAGGIGREGDFAGLVEICDVVIDFTHATAIGPHAGAIALSGRPWVLGTTGGDAVDQARVAEAAAHAPVVQAANFSPGVVLATHLAKLMAAALPAGSYDAEIVEMHHRLKRDAPSGTALALGRAVADGREMAFDAVRLRAREGETGPRPPGGIGFAALRGGAIVGEHELRFTSDTEQLAIVHRAFDRSVFAQGAIRAAIWAAGRTPGLYGMGDVLGLG